MLVLAIDTSTDRTSLFLGHVGPDGGAPAEVARSCAQGNRHAEHLAPMVEGLLAGEGLSPAAIGAVAVGLGPGPYTGLRAGVAAATAFGDALGVPVHGFCSLDAWADEVLFSAKDQGYAQFLDMDDILVVSEAKRQEVYWGCYWDGLVVGEPGVNRPAELPELLQQRGFEPEIVAGRTDLVQDTELALLPQVELLQPTGFGLVWRAQNALREGRPPAPLVPLYLRPPDAKPPASMRGASA